MEAVLTEQLGPSEAVRARVRHADLALQQARFLRLSAGARPAARLRELIKAHEVRAARLLREAEAITRSEADSAWLDGAMAENLKLAAARGEVFEARPIPGTQQERLFMLSRGMGLEHARDNGYLAAAHGPDRTDDLYRLGQRYRTAYEVVEGLASHRSDSPGVSGFEAKGPQTRVVEAGALLQVVRAAVTDRQRKVLDAVCGQGLGLREATKACKMGTPAVRNALRAGLAAGLEALTSSRRAPDRRHDLEAAHAAVAQAGRRL